MKGRGQKSGGWDSGRRVGGYVLCIFLDAEFDLPKRRHRTGSRISGSGAQKRGPGCESFPSG